MGLSGAKEVLRRSGTTAEHAAFTGAVSEITFDSDKKAIRVHDASKAGGWEVAHADKAIASEFKGRRYAKVDAAITDHGNLVLPGSLADIFNEVGSNQVDVIAPNGDLPVSTTLTVPATSRLIMDRGAIFSGAGSVVFSGNLSIHAGMYQIFNGPTLTFQDGQRVHSSWFADLATAITAMNGVDGEIVVDPGDHTLLANYTTGYEGVRLILSSGATVSFSGARIINAHIRIENGGMIEVNAGSSVSLNGEISAGVYQIFKGDGTVTGDTAKTQTLVVSPEWFGASPDAIGTVNSEKFQLAYDFSIDIGAPVVFSSEFSMNGGLVFDGEAGVFMGTGRRAKLDFSGQSSGAAITLGRVSTPNGMEMGGFEIAGNSALTGIVYNELGSGINVARTTTRKMWVTGFGIGISGTYYTTSSIEDVVIGSCGLGADFKAQCNGIDLRSVWFSNCDKFIEIQNCDLINFSAPLFQNITDAAELYGISIRQSCVTMTGPYFEGFNNADIALIGGPGDTAGATLSIMGGHNNTTADIVYRENIGHIIRVSGMVSNPIGIKTLNTSGYYYLPEGECVWTSAAPKDVTRSAGIPLFEFWYPAQERLGSATGRNLRSDKLVDVFDAGTITVTFSTGLVAGEIYTLVYAMKKGSGVTASIREKNGGTTIRTLPCADAILDMADRLEVRYMPIMAAGDTIQFIVSSTSAAEPLAVHGIMLISGAAFPQVDLTIDRPRYYYTTPTTGTWKQGDILWAHNASSGGFAGWICVTGGTPGTWKTFGVIS